MPSISMTVTTISANLHLVSSNRSLWRHSRWRQLMSMFRQCSFL